MLAALGADAVGMSTAVEAIAARHAGMRVCGVSCVANLACGLADHPLSGEEVIAAANEAAPRFRALLWDAIASMKDI
jgi:purine-nucleoside phosphorylase